MKEIIDQIFVFLNDNSGAVQAITTFLLVAVTIVYVVFTYRMQKIASKQITADIKISDIILKSSLERYKKDTEDLKKITTNNFSYFHLFFDVSNRGVGKGSIEKPILVLKIDSDEWKINPKRKELTGSSYQEKPWMISQNFYKDLGGTIYLKGGDYKKIELEYRFSFGEDEEFVRAFKDNPNSLKYYIKYKDNFGKEYKKEDMKIMNIR